MCRTHAARVVVAARLTLKTPPTADFPRDPVTSRSPCDFPRPPAIGSLHPSTPNSSKSAQSPQERERERGGSPSNGRIPVVGEFFLPFFSFLKYVNVSGVVSLPRWTSRNFRLEFQLEIPGVSWGALRFQG